MRNNTYYGALFFPAFLLLLVFRFLRFPGVYLRLLKKKKLPIDQAIPEAIFMLYGQFHEREFLLVSYWREWCFESCGNCLSRRRVQWNWDEYVFLWFFFILFIRQISWQTLNLCPSPVFETLFNEFKNACVFSQLVIQLINRNRL